MNRTTESGAEPKEHDEAIPCGRREEILEAATKLFAEHGFSDTVTQVLVERLQIGKGTLYRYFPSKRELFLAAVDRVMRRLRQSVDAAIANIENPLDRVARAILTYLVFFEQHPEFVELLVQERALFKDRKKSTYFEHQDTNVLRWRILFGGLIEEGRIRKIPVERVTDTINNLLYGTMFTNYFSGRPKPPEQQAKDILDVVFYGILSESERERMGRGCVDSRPEPAPRADRPLQG
ncbi:transcriptional regulator, TetR family [Singulisphaera sp. GP187]|uniref:TetR/AcrR family transcriptional regulator n=1 Tax=Singulisphaera sp. GP187 TaxID=1882752 RepID=UPI00092B100E|nr:TetR/AcrR family transcriptional regulator [Singulisphaera sp. GP187]SIO00221.1 transcriptional regulator, TetR family [Singulisphaera sp. GP187]